MALDASMLLVHGAFMGAWAFQPVVVPLAACGIRAVAIDLPGHGLDARLPASYLARPADAAPATLGAEPSPAASITLEDNVERVLDAIDAMMRGGSGPIVLVGHSMGGIMVTAAAERVPEKIAKLVYLTAFLPRPGVPAMAYLEAPESADDKAGPLLLGDPAKIGALRIDPNSGDPVYRRALQAAFFNDVADGRMPAVLNLLIPDAPIQPFVTPLAHTADRWGRIPRAFVRCTQDFAIRPALQDRMIREADAFTVKNPTHVVSIDAGHAPFVSMPTVLVDVLTQLLT